MAAFMISKIRSGEGASSGAAASPAQKDEADRVAEAVGGGGFSYSAEEAIAAVSLSAWEARHTAACKERDALAAERDGLAKHRDALQVERDELEQHRDLLQQERDGLHQHNGTLTADRESRRVLRRLRGFGWLEERCGWGF